MGGKSLRIDGRVPLQHQCEFAPRVLSRTDTTDDSPPRDHHDRHRAAGQRKKPPAAARHRGWLPLLVLPKQERLTPFALWSVAGRSASRVSRLAEVSAGSFWGSDAAALADGAGTLGANLASRMASAPAVSVPPLPFPFVPFVLSISTRASETPARMDSRTFERGKRWRHFLNENRCNRTFEGLTSAVGVVAEAQGRAIWERSDEGGGRHELVPSAGVWVGTMAPPP
jgi:hypothetical protein